jgi:hypothetical protein
VVLLWLVLSLGVLLLGVRSLLLSLSLGVLSLSLLRSLLQ